MSQSRRSFLALLAGALAVKPESLLAPAEPKLSNTVLKDWTEKLPSQPWSDLPAFQHWSIWDTVIVQPRSETKETLFSAPLPANFAIKSLMCGIQDSTQLADFGKLLGMEFRVSADGLTIANGPLSIISPPGYGPRLAHKTVLAPALFPQREFRLDIMGEPLDLSGQSKVQFYLEGFLCDK